MVRGAMSLYSNYWTPGKSTTRPSRPTHPRPAAANGHIRQHPSITNNVSLAYNTKTSLSSVACSQRPRRKEEPSISSLVNRARENNIMYSQRPRRKEEPSMSSLVNRARENNIMSDLTSDVVLPRHSENVLKRNRERAKQLTKMQGRFPTAINRSQVQGSLPMRGIPKPKGEEEPRRCRIVDLCMTVPDSQALGHATQHRWRELVGSSWKLRQMNQEQDNEKEHKIESGTTQQESLSPEVKTNKLLGSTDELGNPKPVEKRRGKKKKSENVVKLPSLTRSPKSGNRVDNGGHEDTTTTRAEAVSTKHVCYPFPTYESRSHGKPVPRSTGALPMPAVKKMGEPKHPSGANVKAKTTKINIDYCMLGGTSRYPISSIKKFSLHKSMQQLVTNSVLLPPLSTSAVLSCRKAKKSHDKSTAQVSKVTLHDGTTITAKTKSMPVTVGMNVQQKKTRRPRRFHHTDPQANPLRAWSASSDNDNEPRHLDNSTLNTGLY